MILQFQIVMSVVGGWSVRECFSLLVCSVLYSRLSSRDHQQSAAFSPVSSLVLYGVVDFKQACCIQKGVPLVLLHALFSAKKPSISTCRYFGSSHRLHWEISVDYGWVFQTGILKLHFNWMRRSILASAQWPNLRSLAWCISVRYASIQLDLGWKSILSHFGESGRRLQSLNSVSLFPFSL